MRTALPGQFETMASPQCLSITEQWIREKLKLQHKCLADVRSLRLPGTYETGKICSLGISLKNFARLKSLDLSHNALVSVQGILHLKFLENLNLYYNRITSLQDILSLSSLLNLKELDLRLNPVVKRDPYYRLHLVHAITKLSKLDDCAVRDRERKAALMHFSAELGHKSTQKCTLTTMEQSNRGINPRIASVNKMMMSKIILREGNEEMVLNHNYNGRRKSLIQEAHTEENSKPESTYIQENPSNILHQLLLSSHKQRKTWTCQNAGNDQPACLLKDYSERKLHPLRITQRSSDNGEPEPCSRASVRARKPCKGTYGKPMELLLSLVDEYWSGDVKDHDTKHFFMHAVRLLCMMEQEVTNKESEMTALREEMQTLRDKIHTEKRQHQSELRRLSEHLKQAHGNLEHLSLDLRNVLEENLSLQKQLIRLEEQLLSDRMKKMTCTHNAEG